MSDRMNNIILLFLPIEENLKTPSAKSTVRNINCKVFINQGHVNLSLSFQYVFVRMQKYIHMKLMKKYTQMDSVIDRYPYWYIINTCLG